ncbi:OmpA family protein [Suttonella ornithocola]|uniref:Outer membrane protein II n=1 Tax=Suttonella ornithocola TaxID=279832 RepID=A0A380MRI8_9GAMM|nr:OmpA family protein [Suttonella ornithocola]SUO94774.1 Outer membrane protein II* [Suttonella ornithocola]
MRIGWVSPDIRASERHKQQVLSATLNNELASFVIWENTMKLKKLLAVAVLASFASYASAQTQLEDLTSNAGGEQILVKNNFGECVTVQANRNLTGCGAQEPAVQVERVLESQVITLSADTYFNFDKYNLKPEGKAAIQQLAQQLNARGADVQKIVVVGNTDSIGTEAYNQKLSERRAATVANYLIENGVPAQIIQAYGDGENNPVASNKTAEGRALNRRVVITVDGIVERPVKQEVIVAPAQ